MADFSSPGVFIEERTANTNIISGTSPSNLGVVGFTPRGATNTPTLVTSYGEFVKKFGDLTRNSYVGYNVAGFFSNGGTRLYAVRVVPSDATAATGQIRSTVTEQSLLTQATVDGILATYSATAGTSVIKDNAGASPVVGKSISMKWRASGVAIVSEQLKKRDGSTALAGDAATTKFEARLNPASLPAIDYKMHAVVPDSVTLKWVDGVGAKTLVIPAPAEGSFVTTVVDALATVKFDHCTSLLSVLFAVAPTATPINLAYTPATATKSATDAAVAGTLVGTDLTSGSVTLATGAWTATFAALKIPHKNSNILLTYQIAAWTMAPVSKGVWGGDIKVVMKGSQDAFTASSASFAKFDTQILVKDSAGNYNVEETYDELVWDDALSTSFGPEVINALSDLITITEPGGNEAPRQLSGRSVSVVVAGGDEVVGSKVVAVTLANTPIAKRSVSVSYTDSAGTARTIVDDGSGALTGDVDSTGTNTVAYDTGALAFKTVALIKAGTLVTVSFVTEAVETSHSEIFGDTSKGYTAGTDGTFTSGTYGRNQISAAALAATSAGIWALDSVEETMQVAVPDFVGDVAVTGDLLSWAAGRAALPSGADRFVILAVPKGSTAQNAADWARFSLNQFSSYAALYWPWVKIADPLASNRSYTVPPLGHIAGIYARTDTNKSVGKNPGGTVDGALAGILDIETVNTKANRDLVYQARVNPLINSASTGLAVWGVRTLSNQLEWRYINARRTMMYVQKAIFNSTHFVVFENNGSALQTRVFSTVDSFLRNLFQQGVFAGTSTAQAFFVKCDAANNPPEVVAAGQLVCEIGIATNKPAEFVRFVLSQISQ